MTGNVKEINDKKKHEQGLQLVYLKCPYQYPFGKNLLQYSASSLLPQLLHYKKGSTYIFVLLDLECQYIDVKILLA